MNGTDCSPLGSSIHGIFQARILEWVVISFFRGSSWPRDGTHVSCISCTDRQILHLWVTREAFYTLKYIHGCILAQLFQSCLTLWDLTACRLSRSSVHEILQIRHWSGLPCPAPGNIYILCPNTLPPRIYLNLLWIYTKMYENILWTSVDHCVLLCTV